MASKYEEQILTLRQEGNTYKQICEKLNCAKSTVSYHAGGGQKTKNKDREKKYKIRTGEDKYRKFFYSLRRKTDRKYSIEELEKLFPINNSCYLTGTSLNLNEPGWELDHKIPKSKGGTNDIENLGILAKEINRMKQDISTDELIEWSIKLLEFNGYSVSKK